MRTKFLAMVLAGLFAFTCLTPSAEAWGRRGYRAGYGGYGYGAYYYPGYSSYYYPGYTVYPNSYGWTSPAYSGWGYNSYYTPSIVTPGYTTTYSYYPGGNYFYSAPGSNTSYYYGARPMWGW